MFLLCFLVNSGAMIKMEIKDEELKKVMAKLSKITEEIRTKALYEIGETLAELTRQRFDKQEAPDGSRWAELSPVTIARKRLYKTLALRGETGRLRDEISYDVFDDSVIIGSPMVYASTHQFGAKKGQFGKTRRGAPIPWGDIPARPFLNVNERGEWVGDKDRENIIKIIERFT